MKTKEEIEAIIADCDKVSGRCFSTGPCPLSEEKCIGCCAECGAIGVLKWVLQNKEATE